MLGKKYKELFRRCDIMEDDIETLKLELAKLKKQRENKISEEETPYFNPNTRLYDFKYGKAQQAGGNDR